jgi:hypothetical protein
MLSSDELGEKGESRFREICADARLICNKSDRDRAGWDFIVDFNFDEQPQLSLDKRRPPVSCHIQVKTIYETTKSVKLRLTMAERLAKEIKPAFVYVMKVDETLKVVEAYLIHMLDDRLGSVLKRLRSESIAADSKTPINKKFIAFTPLPDEGIDITGSALCTALKLACGDSLHGYSSNKQAQLKTLGFDKSSFIVRMKIGANDATELSEIFLGLRKEIPVTDFANYEKRFGISLRTESPSEAKITITPTPVDRGRILVRGSDGKPPAFFDAELFALPTFLTTSYERLHIRSHLFRLDLFISGEESTSEFIYDHWSKLATPTAWLQFWRMMQIFSAGSGTVDIAFSILNSPLVLTIHPQATSEPAFNHAKRLSVSSALSRIYVFSGFGQEHEIAWSTIRSAARSLTFLDAVLQTTSVELSFVGEVGEKIDSNLQPVILAGGIPLGTIKIAFSVKCSMRVEATEDGSKTTFFNVHPHSTLLLGEEPQEYSTFVERLEKTTKLTVFNLPTL